jgi:hypothetical protein
MKTSKPRSKKPTIVTVLKTGATFPLYVRKPTGKDVPCTGDAHSNPHIDHCMVCLPRWGVVAEVEPELTAERLAEVLAQGFAVWAGDIEDEVNRELSAEEMLQVSTKTTTMFAAIPTVAVIPLVEGLVPPKAG